MENPADEFEFERVLKELLPDIDESHRKVFDLYKSSRRGYVSARESFQLARNLENANDFDAKIKQFIATEEATNDSISTIYQEAPLPSEATGLWDAGKEKSIRIRRENNILTLKKITSEAYVDAKKSTQGVATYIAEQAGLKKKNGQVPGIGNGPNGSAQKSSANSNEVVVSSGEISKTVTTDQETELKKQEVKGKAIKTNGDAVSLDNKQDDGESTDHKKTESNESDSKPPCQNYEEQDGSEVDDEEDWLLDVLTDEEEW